MLEYQKMTRFDLPLVMLIEQEEYEFPWTQGIFNDCLSTKNYHGYLLKEKDELIGYAMISVAVSECHILNICIRSDYQKQGFGTKLLTFLVEKAKQLQAEQIFLEVRASNKTARNLYHQFGFNEMGVRKGYYPAKKKREDAYLFAMEIF